jgi:hypothetical protein
VKVYGNTTGLRNVILRRIEYPSPRKVFFHEVISTDVSGDLPRLSFNKMDIADADIQESNLKRYGEVAISALSTDTVHPLIHTMEHYINS